MIRIHKKNGIIFKEKTKGGYAILELLFYISLFAILSVVVINSMITMTKSFGETKIQAELVQSGTIMERISREIRQAKDINLTSSSDLILNTTDGSGGAKTVEFLLSGSNLEILENGTLTGNLNTPNIAVTGITFLQATTTKGKAVKIILSVRSNDDSLNRVQNFYDTIVLRGSY